MANDVFVSGNGEGSNEEGSVTELGPKEVRWFYKEVKRTWKPFIGHDSLKIKIAYRRFCEQNPRKCKRSVYPSSQDPVKSGEIQMDSGTAKVVRLSR